MRHFYIGNQLNYFVFLHFALLVPWLLLALKSMHIVYNNTKDNNADTYCCE